MSAARELEPGSFRDPDTRVLYADGRVFRALSDRALVDWRALADSGLYERLRAEGKLVETALLEDRAAWPGGASDALLGRCAGVLSHEAIPFVSYPYEWPFEMLKDAARLQLELLLAALDDGLTLKDATPYNVQWRGARPVFVDVGSFERLPEGRPWLGYRQFCTLFLYPLLLQAYKGIPFRPWLRGNLEGISPDECLRMLSFWDRFRKGVFTHVYLHSRFERRYATAQGVRSELKEAGFHAELVRANVRRVSKVVERLRWRPRKSEWSDYGSVNEYGEEDLDRKGRFVAEAARSRPLDLVWDLGCNDGRYSRIAGEHARYVVAIDSDEFLVNRFYGELKAEGNTSIVPLAMSLTDPSPSLGWRGLERKGLTERGRPDLTLCLALIHHVSITGNVPVREFVEWLRELGGSLVIEFVTREDPMARLLLSRKEPGSHPDYERSFFERCLEDAFSIERVEELCEGRRALYFAVPRASTRAGGAPQSG